MEGARSNGYYREPEKVRWEDEETNRYNEPSVQKQTIDSRQARPYYLRSKLNLKNILLILFLISNLVLVGLLANYYSKASEFYDEKTELEEDYDDLQDEYKSQVGKFNRLNKSFNSLSENYSKLQIDYSSLNAKHESLLSNYNLLNQNYSELQLINNKLSDELGSLKINYSTLKNEFENLTTSFNKLNISYNSLKVDYDSLYSNYSQLNVEYLNLQDNYSSLEDDHSALQSDYTILQINYDYLQSDYDQLQNDYDDLIDYYYYQTEVLRRERELYHSYNPYLSWPGYSSYYPFYVEWKLSSYFDSLRRNHSIDWYDFDSVNKYLELKNSFYWSWLKDDYSDSEDLANAILDIVHNLEYRLDPTGIEDVRYPCETLMEGCGDCEDVSILCAAMFEGNGLDAVLIIWPTHVQAGVYLSTAPTVTSGSSWYVQYNGKNYYICECTGDYNWDVGDLPSEYQSQTYDFVYDI